MTSWADNLASDRQSLLAYATITGVGDTHGLWRFSTNIGWALSAGQGTWLPLLGSWPDILRQTVDPVEGGTATFEGGLTLQLVDQDDALTSHFRLSNRDATAVVRTDLGAEYSDITVEVSSTSPFSVGQLLYIGSEVVEVTSITDANTLTASRGSLGTLPVAHLRGAAIQVQPRLLYGRQLDLYVAALDGGDANAELVGSYLVSSIGWSEEHAAWILEATTRQTYLDRKVPREPRPWTIIRVDGDPPSRLVGEGINREWAPVWADDGQDRFAVTDGESIVLVGEGLNRGDRAVIALDHAGSQPAEPEPGTWTQVMSAANDDFRVYPASDPAGSRIGWAPSDHVADILLAILTSSAVDDGLSLNNGPWSGLPVGYGLSVPIADIDTASFLDVRRRWRNARAPDFVLGVGDETPTFRELADTLLRPLGWYVTQEQGKVTLVAPKLPDGGAASRTLGPADILLDGNDRPRFEQAMAHDSTVSAYVLKFGRRDQPGVTVSVEQELKRLFNARDLYLLPSNEVEVEIPHVQPDSEAAFAYRLAATNRLLLNWVAYVRAEADFDPENTWTWRLAENAGLTMPGVVAPGRGTRGLVNATAQLVSVERVLDEIEGLVLRCSMLIQPELNISRIAPAASVASVSGNVVTVSAGRYTKTDGTPDDDVEPFQVGDVVRLRRADRSYHASTQTITAVDSGAGTIELDGDFSGNLAAGKVLVTADADNATASQLNRYAFAADLTHFTVGTTDEAPAVYGQA